MFLFHSAKWGEQSLRATFKITNAQYLKIVKVVRHMNDDQIGLTLIRLNERYTKKQLMDVAGFKEFPEDWQYENQVEVPSFGQLVEELRAWGYKG
tara:strand:+ start:3564 stop:3848 length:285 start_codon:yes stop_codon:yes gene_type:complete